MLALSSADGRCFSFSGGISPELMRSMISNHWGESSNPILGDKLSMRKSPFSESSS